MERTITLPKARTVPTSKDPKLFLIYGPPKVGKTTLANSLENNLIVDIDKGTDYLPTLAVKLLGLKTPANETEAQFKARFSEDKKVKELYLNELGKQILSENKPYDFITVDTVSKLEDMILPLAKEKYCQTQMGANYKGDDVRELPRGAGHYYTRLAFMEIISKFQLLANHVILIGHLRNAVIEKEGKEVDAKDLDLTGKLKTILAAETDALGYVFTKKNEMYISFKGSEELLCGSRCDHLRGKILKIADYDEESSNLININWELIYPDKFSKK